MTTIRAGGSEGSVGYYLAKLGIVAVFQSGSADYVQSLALRHLKKFSDHALEYYFEIISAYNYECCAHL